MVMDPGWMHFLARGVVGGGWWVKICRDLYLYSHLLTVKICEQPSLWLLLYKKASTTVPDP